MGTSVCVMTAGAGVVAAPVSGELAPGAGLPAGLFWRVAVICLVDVSSVVLRPGAAGPWGWAGELAAPGVFPDPGEDEEEPEEELGELPAPIGLLPLLDDGEDPLLDEPGVVPCAGCSGCGAGCEPLLELEPAGLLLEPDGGVDPSLEEPPWAGCSG